MGFCRQTIYNELERGAYFHRVDWADEKRYSADKGQQVHDQNKTAKGPGLKIGNDRAYADFLEQKMLDALETEYRTFDDLPLTLWVEDLMPILGIGRNTAYELVRSGQIKSIVR